MIQREDECRRRVNGRFVGAIWKRMADDISGLEHVLEKGIEYQGCIIPDEDVRRGHRAMKLDGSAVMKSQVRSAQPVT
jgi:hypothetical protein